MRLSKQDPVDPNKRRHFEISIDSPFHILSCQATHANMTLPEYGAPQPGGPAAPGSCHCPTGHRHPHPRVTVPGPQRNPVQQRLPNDFIRPMHLIRQPSMNPPPFDADVPPPPIITPPPQYDTVVESANGLAGYFSRLAHYDAIDPSSDDSESEEPSIGNRRSHLPPLTPGGRLARSMDEQRTWEAIGQIL